MTAVLGEVVRWRCLGMTSCRLALPVCGSAGADVVGGRVESGWPRDAAMFAKTATIAVALGHVSGIFDRCRR